MKKGGAIESFKNKITTCCYRALQSEKERIIIIFKQLLTLFIFLHGKREEDDCKGSNYPNVICKIRMYISFSNN